MELNQIIRVIGGLGATVYKGKRNAAVSSLMSVFKKGGMRATLTWALNKDHLLTSITNVDRGSECGCFCPECGGKLTAKKGVDNVYHFAHAFYSDCTGGVETAIHLLAKDVIANEMKIWIPEMEVSFCAGFDRQSRPFKMPGKIHPNPILPRDNQYLKPNHVGYSPNNKPYVTYEKLISTKSFKSCFYNVDSVEVEKKDHLSGIKPDLITVIKGKKLFVEIANTHFVDDEKLARIRDRGIPTIEIDVSSIDTLDYDSLKHILLNPNDHAKWLFFSHEIEAKAIANIPLLISQYNSEKATLLNNERENEIKCAMRIVESKLPELEGNKDEFYRLANEARLERVMSLSPGEWRRDIYLMWVRDKGAWVECKRLNQLHYKTPFVLKEYLKNLPSDVITHDEAKNIRLPRLPELEGEKDEEYELANEARITRLLAFFISWESDIYLQTVTNKKSWVKCKDSNECAWKHPPSMRGFNIGLKET